MSETKTSYGILGLITIFIILLLFGSYVGYGLGGSGTTTSQTTSSVMKGVVTGYVTVGPSKPVCQANESCTVDLTGYSMEFTSTCPTGAQCQIETSLAPISPSGHYSILLEAGKYSVTGLSPSCVWLGCSATFPQTVTVEGGMQLVFNVNIDTGIR
ncbi:MAG: hypothetical protein M1587_05250 [Thaumarchaeota archaeon]|nr:hypothetical protein [Nitrososphaerota archaeon]MDG6905707.1 hypothetical protein [Nitrososphaerota archaeon]